MPARTDPAAEAIASAVAARLPGMARRPLVLGLCGAQGSGKSTLAAALVRRFASAGLRAAVLSLDDLYLTRSERAELSASVHPLLGTRGVPGTHDVPLGLEVIAALDRGEAAALPRFDKSLDDRQPRTAWPLAPAQADLLIFEGWCVGARPEPETALAEPVNRLEREEDPQAIWRRFANAALAGDYQRLFARLDLLAMLAAPGFDCVFGWRREQEQALRLHAGPAAPGLMSDQALSRFIQHYERLTRHILREMPPRADVVIELAPDRSARWIVSR